MLEGFCGATPELFETETSPAQLRDADRTWRNGAQRRAGTGQPRLVAVLATPPLSV